MAPQRRNTRQPSDASLLAAALAAFPRPAGLAIETVKDTGADAEVIWRLGRRRTTYRVQVREELQSAAVRGLERKVAAGRPWLLVAAHVSPGQADALRARGLQFLDAAGNAYVDLPGLCVFVKGQPRPPNLYRPSVSRLFRPAGVKVIFACLAGLLPDAEAADPSVGSLQVEALAALAGVSLGSASQARQELERQGYLVRNQAGGFDLVQRRALLDRWAAAYAQNLQPKLVLGRFRARQTDWWRQTELHGDALLWGGEVAAAKLTGHLSPEVVTLYTWEAPDQVVIPLGLRADPAGPVVLGDGFWRRGALRRGDCVHPLLVYADLLATSNDRNLETARQVYDRHLAATIASA